MMSRGQPPPAVCGIAGTEPRGMIARREGHREGADNGEGVWCAQSVGEREDGACVPPDFGAP